MADPSNVLAVPIVSMPMGSIAPIVSRQRVLSFDVGIISLAYCLFEVNRSDQSDQANLIKIIKWDLIDLADNRNRCAHIRKNKKTVCGKLATKSLHMGEQAEYYCTEHIGKAHIDLRDIVDMWGAVDTKARCVECPKPACFYDRSGCEQKLGEQKLGLELGLEPEPECDHLDHMYCGVHRRAVTRRRGHQCVASRCVGQISVAIHMGDTVRCGWCEDHRDQVAKYIKTRTKNISQNANKISLSALGKTMFGRLDQIPEFLGVDLVLIENQPTLINPTMKTIASMLFSYFLLRGVHDKPTTRSAIVDVRFCSPANKINIGEKVDKVDKVGKAEGKVGKAVDKVEVVDKVEEIDKRRVYRLTKQTSTRYCRALIGDNPEYLAMMDRHTKKDDLADAYMQGFMYVFGANIPDHYAKRLNGTWENN